jgi:hypothetical protein
MVALHEGVKFGTEPAQIWSNRKRALPRKTQSLRLTTSQSALEAAKLIRTTDLLLRRQTGFRKPFIIQRRFLH